MTLAAGTGDHSAFRNSGEGAERAQDGMDDEGSDLGMRYKGQESDLQMEPREALTGFLESPGLGRLRLDFLVTHESDALYIRCLDFGVMSCGESIEECKENIREAILIYLEDLPEGQSIFKPAPPQYWRIFYELRSGNEQRTAKPLSRQDRYALQTWLREPMKSPLVYA